MIKDILKTLRLNRTPRMAEHLELLEESGKLYKMSTLEVLKELADSEYYSRKNNTIQKLIKQASFPDANAAIESIECSVARGITKDQVLMYQSNEYLNVGANIFIFGAAGSGKTYIASALGINACRESKSAKFMRMFELLSEMQEAKINDELQEWYKKYRKYDVLIIDDFLLSTVTNQEVQLLLELIEYRSRGKSTIFTSQINLETMYNRLGGSAMAEALMDRITSKATKITLQCESFRQRN